MEKVYGKRRRDEGNRTNLRNEKQLFEDEIAKLEMIRDRYPVSFREAKTALNNANGNLVEAFEYLEEKHLTGKEDLSLGDKFVLGAKEEVQEYFDEAIDRTTAYVREEAKHQAWDFWHRIQDSTIALRRQDDVVARIPAAVGIAGLAGSLISPRIAVMGVLGLAGALSSGYGLELQKIETQQPYQQQQQRHPQNGQYDLH